MRRRRNVLAVAFVMLIVVVSIGVSVPPVHTSTLYLVFDSPNPQQGGSFGRTVGMGDVDGDGGADLIIGAPQENVGATSSEGRVYVFDGRSGILSHTLTPANPVCDITLGCRFGNAVGAGDVNGDGAADIIIGAPLEEVGGMIDQGRVYVFDGRTGNLIFYLDDPVPQIVANFGTSVVAGDVNGDGHADIIIGAPGQCLLPNCPGEVFIFDGSTHSLIRTLDAPNPTTGKGFGESLAFADVNGDGHGDLVVGSPTEGASEEGKTYVFDIWNGVLIYTLSSPGTICDRGQPGCLFGFSVAAGDINGDGRADIIVGSPLEDIDANDQGAVYVFDGASGGLLSKLTTPSPNLSCLSGMECNRFGAAVSTGNLGNIKGDVRTDIVVGANAEPSPSASTPGHHGNIYVFDGWTRSLLLTLNCPSPLSLEVLFGSAIAVGDADMDGRADVLVGAFDQNVGSVAEGRAYLYPDGGLPIWSGWQGPLDGSGTPDAVGLTGLVGISYYEQFLAARAPDNSIWYRSWTYSGSWSLWPSTGWSPWIQIPSVSGTDARPAVAVFPQNSLNGKLYFVCKEAGKNQIWYGSLPLSAGVVSGPFSGWKPLDGPTPYAVSVTADSSYLYLAAAAPDGTIWWRRMDTSENWSGWNQVPGFTDVAPAIVIAGSGPLSDELYFVCKEKGKNQLWWSWVYLPHYPGSICSWWWGWLPLDGPTSSAVSLTALYDKVYLAARAPDSTIWYRKMTPTINSAGGYSKFCGSTLCGTVCGVDVSWTAWTPVPGYTDVSPAILFQGVLSFACKEAGTTRIWVGMVTNP